MIRLNQQSVGVENEEKMWNLKDKCQDRAPLSENETGVNGGVKV